MEEKAILEAWSQEEKRKERTANWLIAQLKSRGVENCYPFLMHNCENEDYWLQIIKILGIEEEIKKHSQYISYENILVLIALEWGIKDKVYMPFDPREVPLPKTKEQHIVKLYK